MNLVQDRLTLFVDSDADWMDMDIHRFYQPSSSLVEFLLDIGLSISWVSSGKTFTAITFGGKPSNDQLTMMRIAGLDISRES